MIASMEMRRKQRGELRGQGGDGGRGAVTVLNFKDHTHMGLPWRCSGYDSVLSMQGAQVQSLVRDLRSFMLCGAAKNKTTLMLWLP